VNQIDPGVLMALLVLAGLLAGGLAGLLLSRKTASALRAELGASQAVAQQRA